MKTKILCIHYPPLCFAESKTYTSYVQSHSRKQNAALWLSQEKGVWQDASQTENIITKPNKAIQRTSTYRQSSLNTKYKNNPPRVYSFVPTAGSFPLPRASSLFHFSKLHRFPPCFLQRGKDNPEAFLIIQSQASSPSTKRKLTTPNKKENRARQNPINNREIES